MKIIKVFLGWLKRFTVVEISCAYCGAWRGWHFRWDYVGRKRGFAGPPTCPCSPSSSELGLPQRWKPSPGDMLTWDEKRKNNRGFSEGICGNCGFPVKIGRGGVAYHPPKENWPYGHTGCHPPKLGKGKWLSAELLPKGIMRVDDESPV